MSNARRALYPLGAALILAYFLFFTWKSLHMYFDSDDMYNLYLGWSKPISQEVKDNLFLWKGVFRPMGDVFYRGIFAFAGFNPLPFRITELGLCAINTAVCFWFTRLISASERTAALAALLFAFQARMLEVWYRTTVILDVMCSLFVYIAATLYIGARRNGGDLGGGRIAVIFLAFICALNSVEFAVCLPVLLISWEILFNGVFLNGRALKGFLKSRACPTIAAMGALTLVYTVGKLHGAGAMSGNPFYTPEYSYARFSSTWNEYLKDIFFLANLPAGWVSMTVLGGMLAAAAAARSRVLLFAWVVIIFGLLPVSFSPPRGGFEIYVSYTGWVLYAGAALVALEDLITRRAPQYRTAVACAVFVLVGWRVGKINLHSLRVEPRPWLYAAPTAVRALADQMRAMHPTLPRRARVLFLEDGIGSGEWTPLFIMRLIYNDHDLVVDRLKLKQDKPPGWEQYTSLDKIHHDFVFGYENGRYRQVEPADADGSALIPAATAGIR